MFSIYTYMLLSLVSQIHSGKDSEMRTLNST